MSAASDFFENKVMIDCLLRGQSVTINGKTLSWSAAPTYYIALLTAVASDAAGGTEVTATGYARQGLACSLANWAGTQGDGTTSASTGTSGVTSNNVDIDFGTVPSGSGGWGTIVGYKIMDDPSAGNQLFQDVLRDADGTQTTFNASVGVSVKFVAGTLRLTAA